MEWKSEPGPHHDDAYGEAIQSMATMKSRSSARTKGFQRSKRLQSILEKMRETQETDWEIHIPLKVKQKAPKTNSRRPSQIETKHGGQNRDAEGREEALGERDREDTIRERIGEAVMGQMISKQQASRPYNDGSGVPGTIISSSSTQNDDGQTDKTSQSSANPLKGRQTSLKIDSSFSESSDGNASTEHSDDPTKNNTSTEKSNSQRRLTRSRATTGSSQNLHEASMSVSSDDESGISLQSSDTTRSEYGSDSSYNSDTSSTKEMMIRSSRRTRTINSSHKEKTTSIASPLAHHATRFVHKIVEQLQLEAAFGLPFDDSESEPIVDVEVLTDQEDSVVGCKKIECESNLNVSDWAPIGTSTSRVNSLDKTSGVPSSTCATSLGRASGDKTSGDIGDSRVSFSPFAARRKELMEELKASVSRRPEHPTKPQKTFFTLSMATRTLAKTDNEDDVSTSANENAKIGLRSKGTDDSEATARSANFFHESKTTAKSMKGNRRAGTKASSDTLDFAISSDSEEIRVENGKEHRAAHEDDSVSLSYSLATEDDREISGQIDEHDGVGPASPPDNASSHSVYLEDSLVPLKHGREESSTSKPQNEQDGGFHKEKNEQSGVLAAETHDEEGENPLLTLTLSLSGETHDLIPCKSHAQKAPPMNQIANTDRSRLKKASPQEKSSRCQNLADNENRQELAAKIQEFQVPLPKRTSIEDYVMDPHQPPHRVIKQLPPPQMKLPKASRKIARKDVEALESKSASQDFKKSRGGAIDPLHTSTIEVKDKPTAAAKPNITRVPTHRFSMAKARRDLEREKALALLSQVRPNSNEVDTVVTEMTEEELPLQIDSLLSQIDGVMQRLYHTGKLDSMADAPHKSEFERRSLKSKTMELLQNLAILRARRESGGIIHADGSKRIYPHPSDSSVSSIPTSVPAGFQGEQPIHRQHTSTTVHFPPVSSHVNVPYYIEGGQHLNNPHQKSSAPVEAIQVQPFRGQPKPKVAQQAGGDGFLESSENEDQRRSSLAALRARRNAAAMAIRNSAQRLTGISSDAALQAAVQYPKPYDSGISRKTSNSSARQSGPPRPESPAPKSINVINLEDYPSDYGISTQSSMQSTMQSIALGWEPRQKIELIDTETEAIREALEIASIPTHEMDNWEQDQLQQLPLLLETNLSSTPNGLFGLNEESFDETHHYDEDRFSTHSDEMDDTAQLHAMIRELRARRIGDR